MADPFGLATPAPVPPPVAAVPSTGGNFLDLGVKPTTTTSSITQQIPTQPPISNGAGSQVCYFMELYLLTEFNNINKNTIQPPLIPSDIQSLKRQQEELAREIAALEMAAGVPQGVQPGVNQFGVPPIGGGVQNFTPPVATTTPSTSTSNVNDPFKGLW